MEDRNRAGWLLAGARPSGGSVVRLDGRECRTTEALFGHWAGRLSFPSYFGGNWDAFEECLTDFLRDNAPKQSGLVLRVDNAAELLADGGDTDLVTLTDILRNAAVEYRGRDRANAVAVELVDDDAHLAGLRRRLR